MEISYIFEDSEETLWMGTENSGLTRLKNGKFTHYTIRDGLASNKVFAFLEDKEGRLWVATSAGLSIRNTLGKPVIPGRMANLTNLFFLCAAEKMGRSGLDAWTAFTS